MALPTLSAIVMRWSVCWSAWGKHTPEQWWWAQQALLGRSRQMTCCDNMDVAKAAWMGNASPPTANTVTECRSGGFEHEARSLKMIDRAIHGTQDCRHT